MFEQKVIAGNAFLQDINALRQSARQVMDMPDLGAPETSIGLLQTVLAAEIVCVLRYTMISVSQDGLRNDWIGQEFQEQAKDERKHMKMAAERIIQLGGTPNYDPEPLATRIATAGPGSFARRVEENLAAEQSVIEHYHDLMNFFRQTDPQTCAMLADIVQDEQDHTSDMEDLLVSYNG